MCLLHCACATTLHPKLLHTVDTYHCARCTNNFGVTRTKKKKKKRTNIFSKDWTYLQMMRVCVCVTSESFDYSAPHPAPKKPKMIPRLVSLPTQFYDMESRLFSAVQNRPKTSRTIKKFITNRTVDGYKNLISV